MISYRSACAAAFIEGWIFIIVAATGARAKIMQCVPKSIMLATGGGIGMFLAFIGLQSSEGIGLIAYNTATREWGWGGAGRLARHVRLRPLTVPACQPAFAFVAHRAGLQAHRTCSIRSGACAKQSGMKGTSVRSTRACGALPRSLCAWAPPLG